MEHTLFLINIQITKDLNGYKSVYNYYYIDIDKIMVYKKSKNEYFIRYHDVNKMNYVSLQLKIKTFSSKIHRLENCITLMSIESTIKKKLREIWNSTIKIIDINNANDFVKNTIDDNTDESIMVDVHANTSFVESIYRDNLVIVLHSIDDNYLKTSLAQGKT